MRNLFIGLVLVLPLQSWAGVFDMNVIYATDTIKASSESKSALTAYDFALGIPIGKRDIYVALNYGSFNSTSENTVTTKYSGTDLGIKFGGFFGRGRLFSSSLTYNLKSTVKFSTGSEVELRGSSLKLDAGMNYWFTETAALALRFYYYAPSLSEEVVNGSIAKVSYGRTSMGQALGLSWVF